MQLQFQLFKLNSWSEPVQIIKVNNPNDKFESIEETNGDTNQGIQIEYMNS